MNADLNRLLLLATTRIAPLATLTLLAGCGFTAPKQYVESCDPALAPKRKLCISSPPPLPAVTLTEGARTVRVDAQCKWNRTGVMLEPRGTYELSVTHIKEPWVDYTTDSHLSDGWSGFMSYIGPLAQRLAARKKDAPMYALIGAEGKDPKTFFKALEDGSKGTLRATREEELLFFANDWPAFYRNNHGCVELTVRRLEQRP